jgi:hypothetical protein
MTSLWTAHSNSCRRCGKPSRAASECPHKPLLVLLALGRFAETGSSAVPWSMAQTQLAGLIAEFAPPFSDRPPAICGLSVYPASGSPSRQAVTHSDPGRE